METNGKEIDRLASWLRSRPDGEPSSIVVLGPAVESVALLLRRSFPAAALQVVVENAKEFAELQRQSQLTGASIQVGSGFGMLSAPAELAVLRIGGYEGKQRQQARIVSGSEILATGGTLLVLTHTKRGATQQLAMLQEVLGHAEIAARGGGGVRILEGRRRPGTSIPSPERVGEAAGAPAKIEESVLGNHYEFWTNASVFSKDRVDPGTRLLLETLTAVEPRRILDFGCGYGAMGIVLARRHPASRVTLLDVDAQAVELARSNAALNGVEANTRVVLSDGLRELPGERFDLAVIHFPLHIPRDELERLLGELRDALEVGGCLYGVMLAAYELRPLVRRVFGDVETLEETPQDADPTYKVLRACRR